MRSLIERLNIGNALWMGIIISFLLHALFGSIFEVKISSPQKDRKKFPKVSFLGAILPSLSTTNLTKIYTFKTPQESYFHNGVVGYRNKKGISPFNMKRVEKQTIGKKETIYLEEQGEIDLESESVFFLPLGDQKGKYVNIETSDSEINDFLNEEIMYKPEVSSIKDLFLLYPSAGNIMVEVSVVPEGKINEMVVIKSSGKPIVDIAFKNYLRNWLFIPIHVRKVRRRRIELLLSSDELDIKVEKL